jgi:hypothetical protein
MIAKSMSSTPIEDGCWFWEEIMRKTTQRPDSCRGDNLQSPRPRHCFARMIGER